jgi:hypothetical protein
MEPTSKQFFSGQHFQQHNLVEIKSKEIKRQELKNKEKRDWSVEFLTHDLKTLRYFYRHTIIALL